MKINKIYLMIFFQTLVVIIYLLENSVINKIDLFRYIIIFIYFIYISFFSGYLLLSFSNTMLKNTEKEELFLHAVGISLFLLMVIGFILNLSYNINLIKLKPLSKYTVLSTLIVFNSIILTILIFKKKFDLKENGNKQKFLGRSHAFINGILFTTFLLIVSVIASFIFIYGNNNIIHIFLYILISIIPLLILFKRIEISQSGIIILSLSLLLAVSLSTRYLFYGDATYEYYYSRLAYLQEFWDISVPGNFNSLLRITILHPTHAKILNIELYKSFKIIHPILYSLTPAAVYISYRKIFKEYNLAVYSTLIFIYLFPFYVIMSRNTRNGLAELYLSLFLLVISNNSLRNYEKHILLIIYLFSIIVTHYGTAYLLMIALLFSAIIKSIFSIFISKNNNDIINFMSLLLYFVLAFMWYIYTSSSTTFESLVTFIQTVLLHLSELFYSYSVYALTRDWPFSIKIARNLLMVLTIFITIGILNVVVNIIKFKRESRYFYYFDYVVLSISFYFILLATFLPTKGFNPARVYHLSLIFLSPFCLIGYSKIFDNTIGRLIQFRHNIKNKIFCIILILIILFNSGVISETITKGRDYSPNVLISKPRSLEIDDPQYFLALHRDYITDQEKQAAKWLSLYKSYNKIYADDTAIFYDLLGPPYIYKYYVNIWSKQRIKDDGYIFLYTYNIYKSESLYNIYPPTFKSLSDVYPLKISNKIFCTNSSQIYLYIG